MKKLPLFLTALALVGALNIGMTRSAEAMIIYAHPFEQTNTLLPTNFYDIRASFEFISLEQNLMSFRSRLWGMESNLFPKRIVTVYQDFENGVTDEEADAKLPTLGVEDHSSWAVTLSDKNVKLTNVVRHLKNDLINVVIRPNEVGADLKNNYRDAIYFAVEYSHKDLEGKEQTPEEWVGESLWIRGKIDYRTCVHNAAYGLTDSLMDNRCHIHYVEEQDNGWKQSYYYLKNSKLATDNLSILTWEEEWKQIQAKRAAEKAEEVVKVDDPAKPVTIRAEYMKDWTVAQVEKAEEIPEEGDDVSASLVETPALGETEEEIAKEESRFSWWWVLIPLILGLGMLAWLVWAIWRREEDEV